MQLHNRITIHFDTSKTYTFTNFDLVITVPAFPVREEDIPKTPVITLSFWDVLNILESVQM